VTEQAINGVPTPTLTLQLSHLSNGEDDVLSKYVLALRAVYRVN